MGASSAPSAVITGDVKVGGVDYPFSETVPGLAAVAGRPGFYRAEGAARAAA